MMKTISILFLAAVAISCGNAQQKKTTDTTAKEVPIKVEQTSDNSTFGKVTEVNPEANIKYKKVILSDPYEFKERYDNGSKVIDVRTAAAFATGHISGAINIELSEPEFNNKVKAYLSDRAILVYSQMGSQSQEATHKMEAVGFDKIYNLEGGYDAWKAIGF